MSDEQLGLFPLGVNRRRSVKNSLFLHLERGLTPHGNQPLDKIAF